MVSAREMFAKVTNVVFSVLEISVCAVVRLILVPAPYTTHKSYICVGNIYIISRQVNFNGFFFLSEVVICSAWFFVGLITFNIIFGTLYLSIKD